jgi:hypothetical protein
MIVGPYLTADVNRFRFLCQVSEAHHFHSIFWWVTAYSIMEPMDTVCSLPTSFGICRVPINGHVHKTLGYFLLMLVLRSFRSRNRFPRESLPDGPSGISRFLSPGWLVRDGRGPPERTVQREFRICCFLLSESPLLARTQVTRSIQW